MDVINKNIFHQAEVAGNKLSCFICLVAMIMFMSMYVLISLKVVVVVADENSRTIFTNLMVVLMTFCYILGKVFDYDRYWLKYVLFFSLLIIFCLNYAFTNYGMHIILIIPLILSCRYYSKKFIFFVFILTIIFSYFGITLGAIVSSVREGMISLQRHYDGTMIPSLKNALDLLGLNARDIAKQALRESFIPIVTLEFLVFLICNAITVTGTHMIVEQSKISSINASVEKELSVASDIQNSMLPSVFPPFPNRDDFNIYASMVPAREVGGDLYDFFFVNESKIAILVGDVSGKGVPAAMFMVRARTLIKDYTLMGKNLGDVFTEVNNELLDGNKEGFFVTAWLGIIDLANQKLIFVNAGHNPPLIKNNDSSFKFLKMKPGFLLSGMENYVYTEEFIDFYPGDRILLYTDGVTDARNDNKDFYTENKLFEYVNKNLDKDCKELVLGINEDLSRFANGEEQYDDITLLDFDYKKVYIVKDTFEPENTSVKNTKEKTLSFPVSEQAYKSLVDFLKKELVENGCPDKTLSQIIVAVEELYSNVVFHGYPKGGLGNFSIKIIPDNNKVTLIMKDDATPFNPLIVKAPDITLSAEEREIGGLGIYIVKETMDEFHYERINEKNVVTIVKSW